MDSNKAKEKSSKKNESKKKKKVYFTSTILSDSELSQIFSLDLNDMAKVFASIAKKLIHQFQKI